MLTTSAKILTLALLALTSTTIAAPTPSPSPGTDRSDWIPISFEGKTIFQHPSLIGASPAPSKRALLLPRARGSPDSCGGSSFNPAPSGPYALTADCAVIRDWAYGQNTFWGVWNNTPDSHGLWYYGTCVFEAGTRNTYETWVGSTDVGDITRDALNRFQYNGIVGANGVMGCRNEISDIAGQSRVMWKIARS